MFFNYIKVAFRNIVKYKAFSLINVFGLAVSMSVAMLIIVMVADQKRYDEFHEKKQRTYRILSKATDSPIPYASTAVPLAGTLRSDYPEIEEATHLVMGVGGEATYSEKTMEMRGFFTDPSFFKVFSFKLEKGSPNTALLAPNSMVLTDQMAKSLFYEDDPIGKSVEFVDRGFHYLKIGKESPPVKWGSFTVTGIIDTDGYRSHLKFDVLVSSASLPVLYQELKMTDMRSDWENYSKSFTYATLHPAKEKEDLDAVLTDVATRRFASLPNLKDFSLASQPLVDITPGILVNQPPSIQLPVEAYYFLGFLAFVIMLSACLNYTNLCTARALTRAREIGVRKATGAKRSALIFQFLSESVMIALFALALGILLLFIIKPAFRSLWVNQYLNFDLRDNIFVYFIFVGFAIFIGIVAGIYPAFYLSKYEPVKALKSVDGSRTSKLGMRKVLNVFQFVISLFFLTTSILIFRQLNHFLEFRYGFDPKDIVNIELQGNNYEKVMSHFSSAPGVLSMSASDYVPAAGASRSRGLKRMGSEGHYKSVRILQIDENFLSNLNVPLLAGKNIETPKDSSNQIILVNKAAVRELGYKDVNEILGQTFEIDATKELLQVVGVVEDFRVRMPMEEDAVAPLILRSEPFTFSYINVKIGSGDLMTAIANLEDKWKDFDPAHPFKYQFYDEQLAATNKVLVDAVSILGFLAFLSISIACLGLLGMATYSVERRIKEVGIRKAFGAEDMDIALLVSKQFLKILLVAIVVGAPLCYFINDSWLQNFPNRVDFGIGTLLLGSIILLSIGMFTVGSQTLKVLKRNAAESLKAN